MTAIIGTPVNIDFSDVAHRYEELATGKCGGTVAGYNHYRTINDRGSWTGNSKEQMVNFLHNGFKSPEFDISEISAMTQERRRSAWDEDDGELFVDRVFNGDDAPFRRSRKVKESKSGITINIMVSLAAGTDHSVIAEYMRFCLATIASIEANGHDTEVFITSPLRGLYRDSRTITTRLRVKSFGELSDFTAWSALFAPGGYRHLIFLAWCMGAERNGKRVSESLGTCVDAPWDVTYEDGVLDITSPLTFRSFPEKEMRDKLTNLNVVR